MSNEIEEADIRNLDDYLEAFYEDRVEPKIASARKILLLVLDYSNLEILLSHGFIFNLLVIHNP